MYVDPNPSILRLLHTRIYHRDHRYQHALQPHKDYIRYLLPPSEYADKPASAICTRYTHTSINKQRSPINAVAWTRNGRRCITGSAYGEFCSWDSRNFAFETSVKAHDRPIRSLVFSHNGQYLLSGDHDGVVKYWTSSLEKVHQIQAHSNEEGMPTVRSITFAPGDTKFATCSDDKLIKIWDFAGNRCESKLEDHQWDVKSLRWHPSKALLLSGSKDNLVKLWDAKSGRCVNTIRSHKNTVNRVDWSGNGNWFLTCGKDGMVKLFDIRVMREFQTFKGHEAEVTTGTFHPTHHRVLCTGDIKGKFMYWIAGSDEAQVSIPYAHESAIWDIAFSPLGNVVATASGDTATKFWCRPRPGDETNAVRTKDQAELETSEGMNDRQTTLGRSGFASLGGSSASSVQAAAHVSNAGMQKGNIIQHVERRVPPPGYVCKICNTPGHYIADCPKKEPPPADYVCYLCKRPGHWKSDCPEGVNYGGLKDYQK